MLQYEYNSVYFVCQKPNLSSIEPVGHTNGSASNGLQEAEN